MWTLHLQTITMINDIRKKFQDVEFFLFCLCKYKLDTNVIPGEHIELCTNIHRCYMSDYSYICLCNIKIIEWDVLHRDTRGIIQIMITSRILWFVRANHYQVEKLFWCRKRLFAKKRKIENRKMMEKEIDDFYLWQSLSSFLSDYIVVNLFREC